MPLRHARFSDIHTLSSIFAAGFHDEEVVGALMHPDRDKYPADYLTFWRRRTLQRYFTYSHVFLVSYTTSVSGAETITGTADWVRRGRGWESVWGIYGPWDPRNLLPLLVGLWNRVLTIVYPNRAASPTDFTLPDSIGPYVAYLWSGARADCWTLDCIAVLLEYQKHGFGRELVEWGLERAESEGVAASVMSAEGREGFYVRCGFPAVETGRATDGEGNPLRGRVAGGAIFFRDPGEGPLGIGLLEKKKE